jgi:DNA-binding transcriptional ArsR family regulator/uncharacterized protein YndB with AHSA1/START domain
MEEEFTHIWKALADPSRRMILDLLRERPRTTGELSTAFPFSRFAVMKHLTVLEQAGLIVVKREGRERWNYLNALPLQYISERWLKPYEVQWAASVFRLKHFVETSEERKNCMSEQTATKPEIDIFRVEVEVPIKASASHIFQALTTDIAAWWTEDCSWGKGKVILEPEVGKRFYEDFGNGEGALFGTVIYIEKDKIIELQGHMGMEAHVHGWVRYELEPQEEQTLLKFSHRAYGEISERTRQIFADGWQVLLGESLRNYVEKKERTNDAS